MTDDLDPMFALELELVDFARSFRQIGEAFLEAADAGNRDPCPACGRETSYQPPEVKTCAECGASLELDGPSRAGLVTRALVERYILIDQMAVSQGLAALVGYLARRTGRTPREVHEALFKTAPSDAWWHDRIRQDDEGDRR